MLRKPGLGIRLSVAALRQDPRCQPARLGELDLPVHAGNEHRVDETAVKLQMALLEIKMVMAMLLRNFDAQSVTPASGTDATERMTLAMAP